MWKRGAVHRRLRTSARLDASQNFVLGLRRPAPRPNKPRQYHLLRIVTCVSNPSTRCQCLFHQYRVPPLRRICRGRNRPRQIRRVGEWQSHSQLRGLHRKRSQCQFCQMDRPRVAGPHLRARR